MTSPNETVVPAAFTVGVEGLPRADGFSRRLSRGDPAAPLTLCRAPPALSPRQRGEGAGPLVCEISGCAPAQASVSGAAGQGGPAALVFPMPSPSRLSRVALLGILAAAATALQILEAPLPRLLPWLKPGLSNAVVLYGIIRISASFGLGVVLARTLLTGLTLGILFAPPHLLSLAGGTASALLMGTLFRLAPNRLGLCGLSIAGAVINNLAQLWAVEALFGGHLPLAFQASLMVWVAIPSGLLVARITDELLRRTA